MMMFAIVFGLSMDYEVFLLSRIREEYDRTGDNATRRRRRPGRDGPGHHRRRRRSWCSSSAASCSSPTASSSCSASAWPSPCCVDATIVRMLLVPATMELLGDAQLVAAAVARPDPAQDRRRGLHGGARAPARRPSRARAGRRPGLTPVPAPLSRFTLDHGRLTTSNKRETQDGRAGGRGSGGGRQRGLQPQGEVAVEHVGLHGPAEQVALAVVAPDAPEVLELQRRLHALGHAP